MELRRRPLTMRTLPAVLAAVAVSLASAQQKKEFRYSVLPGATVTVTNDFGSVTVRATTGNQVLATVVPSSSKVEIDGREVGKRIELRTHLLQKASASEGEASYNVQVPAGVAVIVRTVKGSVLIKNVSGDISVESDTSPIDISEVSNVHLHIHSMSGTVTLANVKNANVELTSVNGEVTLANVTGPQVSANTTGANIRFTGDCAGGGEYTLTSHSGNIEVALPASASVDVSARSVNGSVEDAFQLHPNPHPSVVVAAGKSFSGRANAGASSVQLRTFSGKITVKKQ